jgi:hypothetical protein
MPSYNEEASIMNSISRIVVGCLLFTSTIACGAHPERGSKAPCPFTAKSYERVCRHPSMTGAAWREAYACHAFKPELAAPPKLAQR